MSQTLSFRYDLAPTKEQDNSILSHIGAVRYAYNWSVGYVLDNWKAVRDSNKSGYVSISAYSLRKALNSAKNTVAPWWEENSKEAFSTGTANAARSFKNWQDYRNGVRKGHRVGFPKFKKRSLTNDASIRFTTGSMSLRGNLLTVPRIGKVHLFESPKSALWLISEGARITQISISRNGNKWASSISLKMEDSLAHKYFSGRTRKISTKSVGIDVGIKNAYITSDGLVVSNPRNYVNLQGKLRKQQKRLSRRQSPDYKNGVAPSKRWEKARDEVRKTHSKITNRRKDFIHKNTKFIVDNYTTIVIEKLNVKGITKNRKLSKHILDAGFGEFRRQLEYKSRWYGRKLILADTFYPSSKKCSDCGEVKNKLSLSERIYVCKSCGLKIDRDYNAALNLVALSCRETKNGRGEISSGLVEKPNETKLDETTSGNKLPQAIKGS